jgi:hypothetical protein
MLNYLQLEANKTKFKSGINDVDHICEGVNCCKKYVLRHKISLSIILKAQNKRQLVECLNLIEILSLG